MRKLIIHAITPASLLLVALIVIFSTNAQRSTINAQRSTLNDQRPTINDQRSTNNDQRTTTDDSSLIMSILNNYDTITTTFAKKYTDLREENRALWNVNRGLQRKIKQMKRPVAETPPDTVLIYLDTCIQRSVFDTVIHITLPQNHIKKESFLKRIFGSKKNSD